ncbi:DEAD/DEAH box helicase [Enterovibrio paralichthyis]|uniref:DEAD/DEAH box helicase n=1 Tax=Enterovibrio paralichthyis TaxID=2853805 RepID=UPI001C44E10C|nr:DEAD/DEAH box helicase [Enterovibrio paralichthyis]MBV7297209.1 DEAD/DEAH box helicase [Enterovibrio paralichthyis]
MTFDTLTLSSDILRALPAQMTTPTRIQQQAIPAVLRGSDVLALAQTGSGKTLAFGLPMLQRIDAGVNQVQGVVLVPTRELAAQVSVALNQVATPLGIKVVMLCGGVDQAQQIPELENAQLVVATTGRLLDFINQGVVSLDAMTVWAMDEADRLLEMGFWPDVQRIMAAMPAKRQTLLFSATMPAALESIADSLLFKPVRIEAHEKNSVVEDIEERLYLVNKGSKAQALIALIKQHAWKQLLVFVAEKGSADALAKRLAKASLSVAALHGDKDQSAREQTLADFKAGKLQVLIATDLLSRGIHIDALPVVINADLPANAPVYVHRVGRTARAGENGLALSLVCHGETEALNAIRQLTGRELPLLELEGFPVTDKPASETATSERKRAPRDKKANRRTNAKKSIKQFKPKGRG